MTKREKIDLGIRDFLRESFNCDDDNYLGIKSFELCQYLDKAGLVIQVDRELPVLLVDAGKAQTVRDTKCAILKAGFGAFERLIG